MTRQVDDMVACSVFINASVLLGRQELIPLLVRSSLAENLQQAAGQSWPVETIAS